MLWDIYLFFCCHCQLLRPLLAWRRPSIPFIAARSKTTCDGDKRATNIDVILFQIDPHIGHRQINIYNTLSAHTVRHLESNLKATQIIFSYMGSLRATSSSEGDTSDFELSEHIQATHYKITID